jgi:hypothetical protein
MFFLFVFFRTVTNKMSPRPSLIPDLEPSYSPDNNLSSYSTTSQQQQQQQAQQQQQQQNKQTDPSKPPSRAGACRVCLKSFKPDDFSKTCFECHQRVCEDCASYSKLDANEDAVSDFVNLFHDFFFKPCPFFFFSLSVNVAM